MPTKDFFSGMDPERDAAQNGRSDEDASFAGMQKLDFDWLDAGPGSADEEEDLGASFDALFEEQPQQSSRPARGGEAPKAAPFVLGQEDAAAPKQAPAPRPAGANAAPPRPAASRRAAQPSFDLSALEKEIDNHPRTAQPEALEGYTPLSLEGFGFEEEPRPAAPQAAASRPAAAQTTAPAAPTPRATAPQAAPAPSAASTSRPAAPAATPFFADEAPVQTVASAAPTPRSTAPQPSAPQAAPASSVAPTSRPAAPAATPFFADEAPAQNSAPRAAAAPASQPAPAQMITPARTAAPAATGTTPRPAAPVPSAAPTSPTRPAAGQKPAATASASQPAARPLGPGQSAAPRPASRPADYSTISFSLGDVSVEAPTMAFMPIEQINSAASAQAAVNRRTAEKQAPAAPAAPAALNAETRAARAAKERDIGAAVFSALMEQDAPPAPAASAGTGGAARASAATMEWPAAPRAEGRASRAPKPINWRASDETGAAAQPQPPVRPQPPQEALQTPPQPAPEDDFTPLDFDFDGLDAADAPQEAPTRAGARGADFLDRYTDTGEERPPRRSSRNGGSGGARPPRKPSGEAKRGVPSKTVLAWCGILLIAVLVILFFVIFGEKDEAPSSAAPSSTPASSSVPPQSASVPAEPTVTPIPRDEWYMVLANRDSVLPSDFTVAQTQTVGEALVDARIAEALQQMVTDAAAAGIQLRPTNGYRTIARQQELWDARVQKLMTENGLSQADAEVRALDYTSRAGTSDHNTGLGLDIVSEDHPAKDTAYAETAAAQWLAAHAPDYGFILRYPSDKTEVTGMDFEPWHYRYVGVEQAKLIQASGLCLEEYLAQ